MPPDASIDSFVMPWCFGCGEENPHGLGYRPRLESDAVVGEMAFAERFQGGPGVVHGGAIAAFLDDLMGHVPMMHGVPAVTGNLEVSFRKPILVGRTIRGEAWLVRRDGRKLFAQATATDDDGQLVAEATAVFLAIDDEHFAAITDEVAASRLSSLGQGHS